MEELVEMPDHATIDVGYFVGWQSAKVWLVSGEDLEQMYKKYKVGSEIALRCDVQDADETEEAGEDKRKRNTQTLTPQNVKIGKMRLILFFVN